MIWPEFVETDKSAINVSSVSPERWEMTHEYLLFCDLSFIILSETERPVLVSVVLIWVIWPSIKSIKRLGYFESVNYKLQDSNYPNSIDILIEVQETNTGAASFGFRFSKTQISFHFLLTLT